MASGSKCADAARAASFANRKTAVATKTRKHSSRAQPDPADQEFFISFGNALKQRFPGWRAYVLTSDRKLPGMLRLRESTKTPLFNGALECRLFRFDLIAGSVRNRPAAAEPAADQAPEAKE